MSHGYLSPKKLAEYLDVSLTTVWRRVKEGGLPQPYYLTNDLPRFDVREVDAAIKKTGGGVVTDPREIDRMIAAIQPRSGKASASKRRARHARPAA